MFSSLKNNRIKVALNDQLVGHRRVDRDAIVNIDYLRLMNQEIVDIHLPRPYKDYERFIDNILFTFV